MFSKSAAVNQVRETSATGGKCAKRVYLVYTVCLVYLVGEMAKTVCLVHLVCLVPLVGFRSGQ